MVDVFPLDDVSIIRGQPPPGCLIFRYSDNGPPPRKSERHDCKTKSEMSTHFVTIEVAALKEKSAGEDKSTTLKLLVYVLVETVLCSDEST